MKRLALCRRVCVSAATTLLAGSLAAGTWYADAARPDDTGDGLTPETAKRTLAGLAAVANGGDTLCVAAGTYDAGTVEQTEAVRTGTAPFTVKARAFVPNYATLVGAGAETTVVEDCVLTGNCAWQFGGVVGVIFQPLAFLKTPERVTREILTLFREAQVPVVLMDRDVEQADVPHDFVGINNLAAGRALGAHLLARGAKRIHFLMRPNCASVIRDRLDGVLSALGERRPKDAVIVADPTDAATLASRFRRRLRPDAVICESDYVAAQLRNTLDAFGLSVPKNVRLAGFDDVRCARVTTPPLTTVRQPCEDLARTAYRTLLERMRDPLLPARRILLPASLVVRESTR